jgi:hypothetical protein
MTRQSREVQEVFPKKIIIKKKIRSSGRTKDIAVEYQAVTARYERHIEPEILILALRPGLLDFRGRREGHSSHPRQTIIRHCGIRTVF